MASWEEVTLLDSDSVEPFNWWWEVLPMGLLEEFNDDTTITENSNKSEFILNIDDVEDDDDLVLVPMMKRYLSPVEEEEYFSSISSCFDSLDPEGNFEKQFFKINF
jgi:hypothetical protein